jgi:hypothetical protein
VRMGKVRRDHGDCIYTRLAPPKQRNRATARKRYDIRSPLDVLR